MDSVMNDAETGYDDTDFGFEDEQNFDPETTAVVTTPLTLRPRPLKRKKYTVEEFGATETDDEFTPEPLPKTRKRGSHSKKTKRVPINR